MKYSVLIIVGLLAIGAYSIDEDVQDDTKVFVGSLDSFENPAELVLNDIVRETPEHKEVQNRNLKRGTGEYWILMERASQRAFQSIKKFAEENDYDLITANGYLGSIDQTIPVTEITKSVIEYMKS